MGKLFYQPHSLTMDFTEKGLQSNRRWLLRINNVPILASTLNCYGELLYLYEKQRQDAAASPCLDLDGEDIYIYSNHKHSELKRNANSYMWARSTEVILHAPNTFHKNKLNLL